MHNRVTAHRERTLEMAHAFLGEVRRDLERAAAAASDLPPRIRTMHMRVGHSTPEYRTFAIPVPPGEEGAPPEVLSALIAQYARLKKPCSIVLAFDAVTTGEGGEAGSVLIAEARDCWGTRMFLVQPFRVENGRPRWDEPLGGGWRDPGAEEMILDAAYAETDEAQRQEPAPVEEVVPDPTPG